MEANTTNVRRTTIDQFFALLLDYLGVKMVIYRDATVV